MISFDDVCAQFALDGFASCTGGGSYDAARRPCHHYGRAPRGARFFYTGIVVLIVAAMIAIASASRVPDRGLRAQLIAMVAGYGVLPLVLAMPLLQTHLGIGGSAAWFDMLAAFTTTGAAPRYPEALPPTITLWRAMVGWMGGLYILVMANAILLPFGLGGAEIVLGGAGKSARGAHIASTTTAFDRLIDTALIIFPVYGALTLVLWAALAMAGEGSFVALITAMGVVSTSGIAAEAGGVAQQSGWLGEVMIFIALIVALSRHMMPVRGQLGRQMRGTRLYDPELRLGLIVVLVTAAALLVYHWIGRTPPTDATMARAIWGGLLLALSYLTTTGFESYSTQMAMSWAGLQSPGLLLMGLAIIGGGAATTAGGVKLLRIYALMRHGERELEKLVHPHSLGGSGQDARFIRRAGAQNAWVLFMLFALTIAMGAAAMTMTGQSFDASLAFVVAALTNTGPLATSLPDLPLSYTALNDQQMAILGVIMVAGRLELLVLLAVLAPSSWRF
ncbi:MAG: potassium transporter TrkG [Cypionkella sp.]|nr:potassium transporter TrkG [Cypionkella sp.]